MSSYNLQPTTYNGFTLIEVMVALGIFSLITLALISVFIYALRINKETENQTVAAYAAQEQMETMLSHAYNAISGGTVEPKARLADDPDDYRYPFWRQTEVAYVNDDMTSAGSDTGMKRIDVTVFWEGTLSGGEKSYVLTTLVSGR